MRRLPVHFQKIDQRTIRSQYLGILLSRDTTKLAGTNVARLAPDRLVLTLQSMPLDQGLVDREIPAFAIFDEKSRIRNEVEHLLKYGNVDGLR